MLSSMHDSSWLLWWGNSLNGCETQSPISGAEDLTYASASAVEGNAADVLFFGGSSDESQNSHRRLRSPFNLYCRQRDALSRPIV